MDVLFAFGEVDGPACARVRDDLRELVEDAADALEIPDVLVLDLVGVVACTRRTSLPESLGLEADDLEEELAVLVDVGVRRDDRVVAALGLPVDRAADVLPGASCGAALDDRLAVGAFGNVKRGRPVVVRGAAQGCMPADLLALSTGDALYAVDEVLGLAQTASRTTRRPLGYRSLRVFVAAASACS